MKNHVLTLAICITLSATSALAASTAPVVLKNASQTPAKVTVEVTSPAACPKPQVAPTSTNGKAECPKQVSKEEMKKVFEEKMAKRRADLYTALSFTDEQIAKAKALDIKTRNEIKPLIAKVKAEKSMLDKMVASHASRLAVIKQEAAFKSARKDVKKYVDDSNKAFEAILTKEQSAKYKIYQAEKRAKMQKFRREHKHHGPKRDSHWLNSTPSGSEGYKPTGGNGAPPPCPCKKGKACPLPPSGDFPQ